VEKFVFKNQLHMKVTVNLKLGGGCLNLVGLDTTIAVGPILFNECMNYLDLLLGVLSECKSKCVHVYCNLQVKGA
jgi:hypothetical protein